MFVCGCVSLIRVTQCVEFGASECLIDSFHAQKNSLDVANTSCFLSQILPFSLSFVLFTRAPADLCCLRGGAELPAKAGRCLWWKECCVG